jgi:ribosomal protein S27AE
MRKSFCPRCGSFNLQELGDGYYRCFSCGYEGTLGMENNKKI